MARKPLADPAAKPRKTRRALAGAVTAASQRVAAGARATPDFLIVGIGASAGGLEAFTALLRDLPASTGMAFVLIQHLDPKRKSLLSELLGRVTSLPVSDAADGTLVERDRVYVMPPNVNMSLSGHTLRLGPRTLHRGQHMPVDIFLRSLAAERRSRAAAVILSGSLTDGALGVEAIKAGGGITFAQDEASAGQNDMPAAAIGTGCVDFILPPGGIARELVRLEEHLHARAEPPAEEPALAGDARDTDAPGSSSASDLQPILMLLRHVCGADFSQYKMATVQRRIQRRMALLHVASLPAYLRILRDSEAEAQALYNDVLIKVTSFFRDPDAFEHLGRKVLPRLFKGREAGEPLRVWSAGCSTGEEAYSLAICIAEYLGRRRADFPVQIFATDLSEASLDKAREGIYIENIALDVSPDRLRRYFTRVGRNYRIAKSIREMVVFARQNLVKDPPFSRLDLAVCRNLLIYLDLPLQRRVFPLFHYALKPGGCLMLGNSETPGEFSDLFAAADKKMRVYQRRAGSGRSHYEPPVVLAPPPGERAAGVAATRKRASLPTLDPPPPGDLQRETDRILLQRYTPPGIVIDSDLEIIQFRGNAQLYLEPTPGRASLSLGKLLKEGLFVPLRAAIALARREGRALRKELSFPDAGREREIQVEVIPLSGPAAHRSMLILFHEPGAAAPAVAAAPSRSSRAGDRREVGRLEQELAASREYLQNIIEEQDATAEEIKSANEEILSSNEELQSTNEELETAKEELQSANEELHTVNEELQNRNLDLRHANNDLNNLFNSVAFAIVMLSNDGRVRRFTSLAGRLFNLIPSDVGRPFSDIKPNLRLDDLAGLIQEVTDQIAPRELEVQDREGHWYNLSIRPYRTVENHIDGAVVALVDIDALKRSAEEVKVSRDFSEAVVATVREPLLVLDADLKIRSANAAFYEIFRATREETIGRPLRTVSGGQWNIPELTRGVSEVMKKGLVFEDFAVDHDFRGVGHKRLLLNARKVYGDAGRPPLVLLAIEDSTGRRLAEQEVLAISEREQRRVAQDLHDGLGQQLAGVGLMTKALLRRIDAAGQPELFADTERVITQIGEAVNLTRDLARGLHPMQLEAGQFEMAIRALANNVENLFKVACTFHCETQCEAPGGGEGATHLYRIAQEAINNALKHGKPSRISVSFARDDALNRLVFSVQDDGSGIRRRLARAGLTGLRGMGLQIMRYRADSVGGRLVVERGPAGGTLVQVSFEAAAPAGRVKMGAPRG